MPQKLLQLIWTHASHLIDELRIRCPLPHSLDSQRRGIPKIDPFCEALVSKNLLLLENLMSEANLELDNRLLIDDASFRPTVVDEELLIIDLDGLTAFHIAHEATEEVVVEICLLYVVESCFFVGTSSLILLVSCPERCDSQSLNLLRRG